MPIGGDDVPDQVHGWRDGRGRLRRVQADYPNGWRLRFSLTSQRVPFRVSASLRLVQSSTLDETP
tara:strand:- start:3113 stop:3307 length:195 start_codon:yes stop_codon:yes gene_type:complete